MPRTTWRARLVGAAAALLMSAGLLTATVAPASAAITIGPRCGYKEGIYNVCLTITQTNLHTYDVSVGFDRYMSKSDADALLGCPDGSAMFAQMWRDNSANPANGRGYVPLRPGWPASGTNPPGLFADFFQGNMFLDRHRDSEKVFAEVTYHDCRDDIWYTYPTGFIFV